MKEKQLYIELISRTEHFHKHGDWDVIELGFSICENFHIKNAARHTYRWCRALVEHGRVTVKPSEGSNITKNEIRAVKALAEIYAAGYHKITGDYGDFRVKLVM